MIQHIFTFFGIYSLNISVAIERHFSRRLNVRTKTDYKFKTDLAVLILFFHDAVMTNGISFREWWHKVSVQKPIKCNKYDYFQPEVDPKLWNLFDELPILSSEKCSSNQTSIPYEIRGKGIRVENGVLVTHSIFYIRARGKANNNLQPTHVIGRGCV
jgi:hypothetical protein